MNIIIKYLLIMIGIALISSLIVFLVIHYKGGNVISNNDELKLSYEINAGIPFRWEYEIKDPDIVRLDRSYKEYDDNTNGKVGGKVSTAYVFKGIKPGKTTITFKMVSITGEHEPTNITVHRIEVDKNLKIKEVKVEEE